MSLQIPKKIEVDKKININGREFEMWNIESQMMQSELSLFKPTWVDVVTNKIVTVPRNLDINGKSDIQWNFWGKSVEGKSERFVDQYENIFQKSEQFLFRMHGYKDFEANQIGSYISRSTAEWLKQLKWNSRKQVLSDLVNTVKEKQKEIVKVDETAIDISHGAHYVTIDRKKLTAEDWFENILEPIVNNFKNIGTTAAANTYDAANKLCSGFDVSDLIVVMSPYLNHLLVTKYGLTFDNKRLEKVFLDAGINLISGYQIPVAVSWDMPKNVELIVMTTGNWSPIACEIPDKKISFQTKPVEDLNSENNVSCEIYCMFVKHVIKYLDDFAVVVANN